MGLPIENADYFVRFEDLPRGIYAFVHLNADATYTIVIDPRRSPSQILDSYEHELMHIVSDDFFNNRSIQEVESA